MKRAAAKKRPKRTGNDKAFIGRLGGALPEPSAQAAARVAGWLPRVKPKSAGNDIKALLRRHPPLAQILGGVAEAAPYLWDQIEADPAQFVRLLGSDPDRALASLLAKMQSDAATAPSQDDLMRVLRESKTHAALLIALADLGGVWTVAQLTAALTGVADAALGSAVDYLLRDAVKRK
jgi:[glutamine synthetase] adenylyltransferase / [glutamine synthetase]-adenylyl-L-tyrosine phosphorylase